MTRAPPPPDDPEQERRERLVGSVAAFPDVTDPRVIAAIGAVPREAFVPEHQEDQAWEDMALPIGHGQTISAPHMVAIMCTVLDLRPGQRVLEVGTGSGYHAAVLQHLVRPGGQVRSIEAVAALARSAGANLSRAGYAEVEVRHGDGSLGWSEAAPFDRISVAAACPSIPTPLIEQLAVGGRLVVPVGHRECVLVAVERTLEGLTRSEHGSCLFVPLVGRYGIG